MGGGGWEQDSCVRDVKQISITACCLTLTQVKDIDEGTYALLGAASFLGGAMRVPVSLCVILLELTNNLNLLPLMMLVLLTAKAVGDATGP